MPHKSTKANWIRRFEDGHSSSQAAASKTAAAFAVPSIPYHAKDILRQPIQAESSAQKSWVNTPEIPTLEEICHQLDQHPDTEGHIAPAAFNLPFGAWRSKEAYLKAHYDLLRQDSLSPLRFTVNEFRKCPHITEAGSQEQSRIYENVYVVGMTVARDGLALKVEFSTRRAGKRLRWGQSRRLRPGALVALSPASDAFKTQCLLATIASRQLGEVDVQYPDKPCVHLYMGDPMQILIDPQQELVMVEANNGYWEGVRHTLRALQRLSQERSPLTKYIVEAEKVVDVVDATANSSTMQQVQSLAPKHLATKVKLGQPLPPSAASQQNTDERIAALDASQREALDRILTRELAIVQGPPGTGKTHVSVVALSQLVARKRSDDAPIIVTAQTNHAVDQLLRHIKHFAPEFVRLGGQSKDNDVIGPRTLHNVRARQPMPASSTLRKAHNSQAVISKYLIELLQPLASTELLDPQILFKLEILSREHFESFAKIETEYEGIISDGANTPMRTFCEGALCKFDRLGLHANFDEFETFREQEELGEDEEESPMLEGYDSYDQLHGRFVAFDPGFISKESKTYSDAALINVLKQHPNVGDIPLKYRPSLYGYWRRQAVDKLQQLVRSKAREYKEVAQSLKFGRWETDWPILKSAPIVGMTTTGLCKYRGLVASLEPSIVLVEEAAETFEGYTAAACLPSLKQLILVGDHQQLRAHCTMPLMQGPPCYLDISMFERLINNKVAFSQLKVQRRSRPEIRSLISPLYPELKDHHSVRHRTNVPGMGGYNWWFFHHDWMEHNDEGFSKQNLLEAEMVVGFYRYLIANEVPHDRITILTFYSGQRRVIRRLLSQRLGGTHNAPPAFKIATVDGYQGEENDIVLLSLVRSNLRKSVGFLRDVNRACVSLSRARCGLYVFGNGNMWWDCGSPMRDILAVIYRAGATGTELPVTCEQHGVTTWTKTGIDFDDLEGGCRAPCRVLMKCGHQCPLKCHVFPHDGVQCLQPCRRTLSCGHVCDQSCFVRPHRCSTCPHSRVVRGQENRNPPKTTMTRATTHVQGKASTQPAKAVPKKISPSRAQTSRKKDLASEQPALREENRTTKQLANIPVLEPTSSHSRSLPPDMGEEWITFTSHGATDEVNMAGDTGQKEIAGLTPRTSLGHQYVPERTRDDGDTVESPSRNGEREVKLIDFSSDEEEGSIPTNTDDKPASVPTQETSQSSERSEQPPGVVDASGKRKIHTEIYEML